MSAKPKSNNKEKRTTMKRFKDLRKISLVSVIALGFLVLAPTSSNAVENATLNIKVVVINDDGGTATPADFTMHVRYLMKEIPGSPFVGVSDSMTTFSLAPGSYLITENDVPISGGYVTYYGNYSGTNITDGFVTLAAGETVTITRTENDWPAAGATVTQPVATPIPGTPTSVVTPTQTGGVLPTTSSPWYNMLAISFGLVLLGGLGFKTRKAVK
jgi:hypothetical protein